MEKYKKYIIFKQWCYEKNDYARLFVRFTYFFRRFLSFFTILFVR